MKIFVDLERAEIVRIRFRVGILHPHNEGRCAGDDFLGWSKVFHVQIEGKGPDARHA